MSIGSSNDCDIREGLTDESSASLFRAVFMTSLSLLAAYVIAGAYYIGHTQELSIVDSLHACYLMLATSKLPDSFQLDQRPLAKDPFKVYKTLQSSSVA